MSDPYHAGQNCKCYANSEVDCCCGADWTDPEIYKLRAENSALRALLNEPYQFFSFGHRALEPWGQALTEWCERAEQLGFKKEAKP